MLAKTGSIPAIISLDHWLIDSSTVTVHKFFLGSSWSVQLPASLCSNSHTSKISVWCPTNFSFSKP